MINNFSFTISTDKTEYKIGDTINIEFLIKNNSNKIIYFPLFRPVYTASKIKLFEASSERQIEWRPFVMIKIRFSEKREDFTRLASREEYKCVFSGVIKQGKINYVKIESDNKESGDHNGLYIDFINSIVLLGKSGEYILQGYLLASKEEAQVGKEKLNLLNVWSGEMLSDKIKITIK